MPTDKPNSRLQKYRLTGKGRTGCEILNSELNPKFAPPVTSYSLPATAAAPQSTILQILSSCRKFIQNPKSTIQNQ